ncbi:MAG: acyl-CoA thioesterase [Firmicutes bacterium]|nr:acyl-CoA thioesterase [Bacillota bacterium]
MKKTVSDSRTTLSQVMQVNMANPAGNIHGGEIMKIMDTAAGAAAKRHARSNVVTARVTEMEFLVPVHVGDLVICTAELAFVGHSSMEVLVTVEVENPLIEAPPKVALTGYFTMVAIDENGKSKKVPELVVETPEEKKRYEEREKIYWERKKKLAEAKKRRT